jgi:[ribosomal protein S18]-alanine N-acetyltransferase
MDENWRFRLTTDPGIQQDCARMMSESDPWIRLGMNFSDCQQAFAGEGKETYVLESADGQLLGFAVLQTGGSFRGYIQTLCIAQMHRGHGLGRALLQFCEDRILRISPNIFICVSSFNQEAIRLYLDFGFELVGELKNFVREGFTELLMRKTVGPILGYGQAQGLR